MVGRHAQTERIYPAVLRALAECPQGATLRELARRSGIPVSTLRYHLDRGLALHIEDLRVGSQDKPFARLLRLKPGTLTRQSQLLQRILREDHV